MRWFWNILKALPLGLGVPLVIGGASIGPEEAASNLSKWAYWLGAHNLPSWLLDKGADHEVVMGAVIFGFAYAVIVFVLPRLIRHNHKQTTDPVGEQRWPSSQATADRARCRASLDVHFKPDRHPYRRQRGPVTHYRIRILNSGDYAADGVRIRLRDVRPRPREFIRADFPYRVARAGAEWDLHRLPIEDTRINPRDEELFEVLRTWLSDDKHMVGHLDTKENGDVYPYHIHQDEQWTLSYELTSSNAMPINFSLIIRVEGDAVVVVSG